MEAQMMGVKISSTIYGKNKFKNKNSNPVSYQIKNTTSFKEGHFIRDKTDLILYSPVKLKYVDNFESKLEALFKANKCWDNRNKNVIVEKGRVYTSMYNLSCTIDYDGLEKKLVDLRNNLKK